MEKHVVKRRKVAEEKKKQSGWEESERVIPRAK